MVPWIILPESAETAAASSETARSCIGNRQLQRENLELPGELYLTTQVESRRRYRVVMCGLAELAS